MKMTSLRLRLLLAAAVSITAAVTITGFILVQLFTQYIERRVYAELEIQLQLLTEALSVAADGTVSVAPLADQRFSQPFSGLYWQVQIDGDTHTVSRSLWDEGISFQPVSTGPAGQAVRTEGRGPSDQELLVAEWTITVSPGGADKMANLAVAADRSEIADASAAFTRDLALWLSLLAIALLLAASVQVGVGLRPLELLRGQIAKLKTGASARLVGNYPREVSPLVDEVNELLDIREESLAGARARAGDLAHGLKTPLTILAAVARDTRKAGDARNSDEIDSQIAVMRRHVERELSRARIGVHKNARCQPSAVAQRMIDAMRKLPGGGRLAWQLDLPDDLTVALEEQDMSEVFGNLLDNARIWAGSTVRVSAMPGDGHAIIMIDDDGPGVPGDKIETVIERGERLDETKQGSGLGLAIANDIAMAYGGTLDLSESPLGGLRVSVRLPAAG